MAIFHLSVQVIKRSEGRSVVAAAAYRAAERLVDDRLGVVHNFASKQGVEYREILAPEGAPTWVSERERLWNETERAEKRRDAQLAREVRVGLPKELSASQQLDLVRDYISEQFVAKGMIADLAIHRDNPENPHAHILVTMREIMPEGFGKKVREWNADEVLLGWREQWAMACNRALALAGSKARVTHLSHAARGLLTLPGVKIGLRRLKLELECRGFVLDRLARQRAIRFRNGEAIRKNPRVALQELTYHEAVFTRDDLEAYLATRTVDGTQAQACEATVMSHADVVFAGTNEKGKEVYTTCEVLEHEQAMLAAARTLKEKEAYGAGAGVTQQRLEAYGAKLGLSEEQAAALVHVVLDTGKLAVVEGFAGTGKSRMFDAARYVWQKQGKRVLGAALAGKAAEELGHSASLKDSRSLAAWEFAWKQGRDWLTRNDVLIIDEAGMVGTRQMRRVFDAANAAGAKVVLAGDVEQLQAVEAGSPFHAIGELVESKASLSMVRRQRHEWQRQASQDLAQGRAAHAVAAYSARGCLHYLDDAAKAVAAMMDAWEANEKADKNVGQVALSYRRAHIPELNLALRSMRQEMGAVIGNTPIRTETGVKKFGVGDRVCFTRNSPKIGVRNGSLGTIINMGMGDVTVRLDGEEKRTVVFDSDWMHVDYGYAISVHRSQGITVDKVHVLLSRAFDRHAAYVAMTRHRDRLDLYASEEEFGGRDIGYILSRERKKRLALDYMAAHLLKQKMEASRRGKEAHEVSPQESTALHAARRGYAAASKGLSEAIERNHALHPALRAAVCGLVPPTEPETGGALGVRIGFAAVERERLEAARGEFKAARGELAAAREVAEAEKTAGAKPLSVSAACNVVPETADARRMVREAADVRTFWRAAVEREAANQSWSGRLGLGRRALERDPVSGEPMSSAEGLRAAERRVKVVAENFEHLCQTPAVQAAARRYAAEHNLPIKAARENLAKLRKAYEVAKTEARALVKAREDLQERARAQVRTRETADLEI